jgi:hypothetical protein
MRYARAVSMTILAVLSSIAGLGQTKPTQQQPTTPATQSAQQNANDDAEGTRVHSTKGFVLDDGTPVKLRLNRNLSSADAHTGDTVDFEVLEDVYLNDVLVVPKGGLAFATVTEAEAKKRMARGGKLDVNIDYVRLVDGEKCALRATEGGKGGGHTGGMVGGMVATSLVFFPAAPFFLFMHGKDITIPKGTQITAYTSGDDKLDQAKFLPVAKDGPQAATPPPAAAASCRLQINSNPPGAEIEIDGGFVGDTPSEIQTAEGEHTVVVKKTGFKDWEKKLRVSAGSNINLAAELTPAN